MGYLARNRIERFFNRIKHSAGSPRATKNTPQTSSSCSSRLRQGLISSQENRQGRLDTLREAVTLGASPLTYY
jgi:hypothetical protein